MSGFNSEQLEAVQSESNRVLVLAGAGTGKTKTLTGRVEHILLKRMCNEQEFLALTFTNKAANEMKERLSGVLMSSPDLLWIGTFHGVCYRIIREYKLPKSHYLIMDEDDQKAMIKSLTDGYNDGVYKKAFRSVYSFICEAKLNNFKPDEKAKLKMIMLGDDIPFEAAVMFYREYETNKDSMRLLDFDDLLIDVVEELEKDKSLQKLLQDKFKHILVDEYQDTSEMQEKLISLLTTPNTHLFVVGDDNQSIYSWRGADIKNILDFPKRNDGAHVVRLVQNYRSTNNILNAANNIISNNPNQFKKDLFSELGDGSAVNVFYPSNNFEEARWIADNVKALIRSGENPSNICILYRSHIISSGLEKEMVTNRIPYQLFGGLSFWRRKEVKDIMSFIFYVLRPEVSVYILRTISMLDGVGPKRVQEISEYANTNNLTIIASIVDMLGKNMIRGKAKTSLDHLVAGFNRILNSKDRPAKMAAIYLKHFDLAGYYESKDKKFDQDEFERITGDVILFLNDFEGDYDLSAIAEKIALDKDAGIQEEDEDKVTLMTIHGAKGLEWPIVFIAGANSALLPSPKSDEEEERRVMYVAITRAKRKLIVSSPGKLYDNWASPSKFIDEMDLPPNNISSGSEYDFLLK